MLRNRLLILVLVVGVLAFFAYSGMSRDEQNERIHYHAGFRVYIDDSLQDYRDYKFMNFVPCTAHDEKKSAEDEQIELAHLHDGVGDVVHVHRSGAKWGDLFKNIGVVLPQDKGIKGYIEGVENEDIMETPIKAYSTAIFVVGSSAASHDKEVVSVDHIKEIEDKSELCGSN